MSDYSEYPDNSHNARDGNNNSSSPPEKKLEKVVSGSTKTKKKSDAKKFAGWFIPENASNVKTYIFQDVIIPGIKKAIADIVSIVLFGETGRIGRRKESSSSASYQRYYDDRKDYSRPKSIGGFEYDDIIFETRGDAELVLEQLEASIDQYGLASVADLYDLAGITPKGYTANNYGWTDLRNAKVVRIREGYILQLPRTIQIS